jgi:solute carrier family 25 carnitine/acylcarnitine transporter 20/29
MQASRVPLSTLDAARLVWRQGGGSAAGFFRGGAATTLRLIPGWGVYFVSYEYICRVLASSFPALSASPLVIIGAGGTAGVLAWLTSLPQDVVKSRIQMQSCAQRVDTLAAFRELARGGLASCYKGLAPTLVRAFIANAVVFLVADYCKRSYRRFYAHQHAPWLYSDRDERVTCPVVYDVSTL